MRTKSITIIGCGRRVRQDVVVSALSSGISKSKIQILSKRPRKILIRNETYYVKELEKEDIYGEVVYLAIPSFKIKNIIIKNLNKIKNRIVIIDTPIVDKNLKV